MGVKILVPTSGPEPAKKSGKKIMKLAKKFDAELVIVHIRDQGESREGDMALDIFDKLCIEYNVKHKLVPAIGEISSTIIGQAKFHEVDIIILGATEGRGVANWVMDRIMSNINIPVLILPWMDS